MCKRVEREDNKQEWKRRGGGGGAAAGVHWREDDCVWRAGRRRQKQTGGQPSEAAGERGGAPGLERARGLEPQEGAASVFLPGGSAQPAGG